MSSFHRHGSGLGYGALVIEGEETAQDFFAGRGADRVADAVIFRQGFDFVEIVAEVKVVPAVSIADSVIEFAVQAAQFEDAMVAGPLLPPGIFCSPWRPVAGVRLWMWKRL